MSSPSTETAIAEFTALMRAALRLLPPSMRASVFEGAVVKTRAELARSVSSLPVRVTKPPEK